MQPTFLLDEIRDSEIIIGSNVPMLEVTAEVFPFTTTQDNQIVEFSVTIPFTVHEHTDNRTNGAVRVYLDGSQIVGNQWNGELLMNGGQWQFAKSLPANGRCSGVVKVNVPNAGSHVLRVQVATSSTLTIMTLRSRRRYQIVTYGG